MVGLTSGLIVSLMINIATLLLLPGSLSSFVKFSPIFANKTTLKPFLAYSLTLLRMVWSPVIYSGAPKTYQPNSLNLTAEYFLALEN